MSTAHDIDPTQTIEGPYGRCEHVEHPSVDDLTLPAKTRAALSCTLGTWLITAPGYHPAWSQYLLSVCRLDEHPDLPPPHIKFLGATHELMLFALEPGKGPGPGGTQTVTSAHAHCRTGTAPMLTPINICEQYQATDDEMNALAWLAARAICNGCLIPETGDAPALIREHWLGVTTRTLAHLRGEAHAH